MEGAIAEVAGEEMDEMVHGRAGIVARSDSLRREIKALMLCNH
jgi:hypothetical protein